MVFPTLTCGVFVFSSVSAPSSSSSSRPPVLLTHSLAPSLARSLTHARTHARTHSVHCQGVGCMPWRPLGLASFAWQAWGNVHCRGVGCTPWRPLGLRLFCVAGVGQCALPRGRMYALASLGSPNLLHGRRWRNVHCQGVGCTPFCPLGLRLFCVAGVANVHCQGVGCTPWRPLGLRLFCVEGVAQCALPRGRMYALASLGSPPLLRGRRGTMCTARGRMYALASLNSPPLLRGMRGAMCTATGSDVRPGVPWVSASFAWQAWDNVHCQGSDARRGVRLGLRLFFVAGVAQCALPRGRMYALASLGSRLFCVAGVAQCALPRGRMYALASRGSRPVLRGRRGAMCTAKGSDVRPGVPWVSASFAWQAWRNVHCQGVGCTPWRPLGLRLFCVAGRGTMCAAKGSDVLPWRPLGLRLFCVAGVGQCALPRGRMYALASLGSPPLLRGRRGAMCTAKGSDVRPGVPWGLRLFCVAGVATMCTATGSDVRPWRPLGLRLFCVAGVGPCALPRGSDVRRGVPWVSASFAVAGVAKCALPRGRMYALASLGSPHVSASFAWQAWHNVHCQGVGCTPWRPLGLRLFCVAGMGQCALPKGLGMYALASPGSPLLLRGRRGTMCTAKGSDVRPGVPWVSASFAWQAWHNVHCQGVGCMPLRPRGSPPVFAWQAWDNVHCQGLGCAPWRPLGLLRFFCVAGRGAMCRCQGVGCTPWRPLGSPPLLRGPHRGTMCTAKGSDVRPGVPWVSVSLCVAGVAQCALPRGRMYALASPGSPSLLSGRRSAMCTAKGSDVRPGVPWVSASFAWQAWHNVHCQGVRMYALASLGSPPLLRGPHRGTMCTAKGSDVRPGVPWVSASFAWQAWDNVHCQRVSDVRPGVPWVLRFFCVAGRGTMCTAKGSDVRRGVPWVSASFAWPTSWHNVHCQGVGCTPWRPLGSPFLFERLKLRRFHVCELRQCVSVIMLLWWFQAGLMFK